MFVSAAPQIEALITRLGADRVVDAIAAPPDPRAQNNYLHWDKVHRLDPPVGLTPEQWWLKIKLGRRDQWRPLPLEDRDGNQLGYTLPDALLRSLHRIDQRSGISPGGEAALPIRRQARERFFASSLMEEAIRSSQLEGAMTSRGDAQDLLRSGRVPQDRGEQMIASNYDGLQFMRDQMGADLSPDGILDLHRVVTAKTLDDPTASGRLQRPDEERVKVYDRDGGRVFFLPPPAEQLPRRIELLCDFAN